MDNLDKLQRAGESVRLLEKQNEELSMRIQMKKRQIEAYLHWVNLAEKELAEYKAEFENNERMIEYYKAS
jgi:hypothetical protein